MSGATTTNAFNERINSHLEQSGGNESELLKKMVSFVENVNATDNSQKIDDLINAIMQEIPILSFYDKAARLGAADPLEEKNPLSGHLLMLLEIIF